MARSRKQAWLRDELVLALDLYMREGKTADVHERRKVSDLLRSIPIEQHLAVEPGFRGEKAVAYKLYNFVALDPSDPTTGFSNGGAADAEVWDEFASDPVRLRAAAAAIEANLEALTPAEADKPDEEIADAPEGRLLTRVHVVRERSQKLVTAKKTEALAAYGKLACEGCGFDFAAVYGERGDGFVECHHTTPVSKLKKGQRTKLADLALVCSNCHRIIHRKAPWLTMAELQQLVAAQALVVAP